VFSHRILSKSSGMSLISALIAVAIMGIVAVGAMSIFEGMGKSQNMVSFRSQADTFVEEVRAHLSQPGACSRTLSAVNLLNPGAATAINSIQNSDGSVKYDLNTPYENGIFYIKAMSFVYTPGNNSSAPTTKGQGSLLIYLATRKSVLGPSELAPKSISVNVSKSVPAQTLLDCIATSKMTDGIWQRSSTINSIFFAAGNVGVGSADPKAKLTVEGGEVKFGSSGAPCSLDLQGSLKWESGFLQSCDGVDWINAADTYAIPKAKLNIKNFPSYVVCKVNNNMLTYVAPLYGVGNSGNVYYGTPACWISFDRGTGRLMATASACGAHTCPTTLALDYRLAQDD